MGPGTAGLWLSGLAGGATSFLDVIRSQLQANKLNKLREEGIASLRGLGEETKAAEISEAERLRGRLSDISQQEQATKLGTATNYATSYFGQPSETTAATNAAAIAERKAALEAMGVPQTYIDQQLKQMESQQAAAGIQLGQGGQVQYTRDTGTEMMDALRAQESARRTAYESGLDTQLTTARADYNALKEILGDEYRSIVETTERNLADLKTQTADALKEARSLRSSALKDLTHNTAYAVASQTTNIASEMTTALSALTQKYAGQDMTNPAVQDRYNAEKKQIETQYKASMNSTVQETELAFSELQQTVHANHAANISNLQQAGLSSYSSLAASGQASMASAYGSYSSGMTAAFNSMNNFTTSMESLRGQSMALESEILSNGEMSLFNQMGAAFANDATALSQFTNAVSSAQDEFYTDQAYAEMTYSNLVNSAGTNYANLQSNAAQAMINASYEFVPWSTPYENLMTTFMNIKQLDLQSEAVQAQQDAASAAQLGAIGSFMPSVGFST